ncbi:hypothetical protein A2368_00955 [Candidatus Collierbacteria bacterium RIFOXYB1_FULL_49_13]|uniref:Uncharacterized protein n=1 Tax=Candidatus Collierbacteria bacterium RIFOXYB1_FULL_49_13 TaxID=1817728 RepID=A0A1F5FHJ3_9BACT|nr:MAG: hypothetical protein A2368_00955 [Candidatus Collierbacteria bacterium RIFOXYB1_FULL_49_13]
MIGTMIIEPENSDFDKLSQKLTPLVGKQVFQAYHTYGTMFLFDCGERIEKVTGGKISYIGECSVVIEADTRVLTQRDVKIVDSSDDVEVLRSKISTLTDLVVQKVSFAKSDIAPEMTFHFSNNITLDVSLTVPKDRSVGVRLPTSNWIDIGPGRVWKEVTGDHIDK